MGEPLRVIQFGLGPIGCDTARLVATRPELQLVAGVDVDPDKAGCSLRAVAQSDAVPDVPVVASLAEAPAADVALHTAGSRLDAIADQLRTVLAAGLDCVSSSEELCWPWYRHPEIAAELDHLATEAGARLLGTGVNPGYVLDLLPVLLTAPCREVRGVYARRVVDLGTRRPQLQAKAGFGMTPEEFERLATEQAIGHVGLEESVCLIAAGLGWELDGVDFDMEAVLADEAVATPHGQADAGQAVGSRQRACGHRGGEGLVELELEMVAGVAEPHDLVRIAGHPPLTVQVEGGVAGDAATPACMVNALRSLRLAPPGLRTALDLVVPHFVAPATGD